MTEAYKFSGEYICPVERGRIHIPSELKEILGLDPIMIKGILFGGEEGSIYIYPEKLWDLEKSTILDKCKTVRDLRRTERHLYSGSWKCEADEYNRVYLPRSLRKYSGIDREAAVLGAGRMIKLQNIKR